VEKDERGNGKIIMNDFEELSLFCSKISKLSIFSLVLSILSLYFFIVTGLAAILFGYKSLLKIKKSDGKLRGKSIAIAAIIVSPILMGLNSVLFMDAAPVKNDYTMDYFEKPDSLSLKSYATLQSLGDKGKNISGAPAIGFDQMNVRILKMVEKEFDERDANKIKELILKDEPFINGLWSDAAKGRDILSQLDKYAQISELSEINVMSEIPPYANNLRYLFSLYRSYIHLQIYKGYYNRALTELKLLDSINKKMSLGSCSIFTKKINMISIYFEIEAANLLINNPNTPNEVLLAIKPMINEYSLKHASLNNVIVYEYLNFKERLSKMRHIPLLKYNSTIKYQLNIYQIFIDFFDAEEKPLLNIWPDFYSNIPLIKDEILDGKSDWFYKLYNPCGFFIGSKIGIDMKSYMSDQIKLISSMDMIRIILYKRLGSEEDFKTIGKKSNYIFDMENKKIYSIIPEIGECELPINPEVLGN